MPPPLRLRVLKGDGQAGEIHIPAEGAVLGRGEEAQFRFRELSMSRKHCRIALRHVDWIVEDLVSSNGTYINGQRLVAPRRLDPGDCLQMGQVVLRRPSSSTVPVLIAGAALMLIVLSALFLTCKRTTPLPTSPSVGRAGSASTRDADQALLDATSDTRTEWEHSLRLR